MKSQTCFMVRFLCSLALSGFFPGKKKNEVASSVFLRELIFLSWFLIGGPKGFSDVIWKVKTYENEGPTPKIVFSYHSTDGEEGQCNLILVFISVI